MKEYRCTRNELYQDTKCLEHNDLSARSGYYVTASTEEEAIAQMKMLYPSDDRGFTAQLWKTDCKSVNRTI